MTNEILLYIGSTIIILWGIGHLVPTKSIVRGFGELSGDNRKIITMEWIAEGYTLCFIGVLVMILSLTFGTDNPAAILAYRLCGLMLIVLAALSMFTGARTSILPMKLCPAVKMAAAILFFIGSL
ncbi:MAG: hypothetical protein KKG33_07140 [candidate division Zixibacteria bacterium]|nr:hypothetical protein [candidate division Zixibacteria bacterium]MBU1470795.1 hypothetical protein [candidate division Zixibacteria bacterium]MBU2625318.1 hypothetical protein [candidate division Zixibacteria bacterium]